MFLTTLTLAVIAALLCGLAIYGYRRARKVWVADRLRAEKAAADLLASLDATAPPQGMLGPAPETEVKRGPVQGQEQEPTVRASTGPLASADSRGPQQAPEPAPVGLEEEMRAFFAGGTPAGDIASPLT